MALAHSPSLHRWLNKSYMETTANFQELSSLQAMAHPRAGSSYRDRYCR